MTVLYIASFVTGIAIGVLGHVNKWPYWLTLLAGLSAGVVLGALWTAGQGGL